MGAGAGMAVKDLERWQLPLGGGVEEEVVMVAQVGLRSGFEFKGQNGVIYK